MPAHTCHALGCRATCEPRMLMCYPHWRKVPPDLQAEVYRTVKMRGRLIDETWAPWWRAQAKAIAHVANLESPNTEKCEAYLKRELAFADTLERR